MLATRPKTVLRLTRAEQTHLAGLELGFVTQMSLMTRKMMYDCFGPSAQAGSHQCQANRHDRVCGVCTTEPGSMRELVMKD
jgi:hypothetical protein